MNGLFAMILRQLVLSVIILSSFCSAGFAQANNAQNAVQTSETQGPLFTYFAVTGAVQTPGVYELGTETATVGELLEHAGHTTITNCKIAVVRPLKKAQIQAQLDANQALGVVKPLILQTSFYSSSPKDQLLPGDVIDVQSNEPSIQQTQHQTANPNAEQPNVDIVFANLIPRPVHLTMAPKDANVASIAGVLGISPETVQKNAIVVLRAKTGEESTIPNQALATEPLPAGTILIFDPTLIQFDQLNTTAIQHLTQNVPPIRVAAKNDSETRTDVSQSDLLTQTEPEQEPDLDMQAEETLSFPEQLDKPTPAPEEEKTAMVAEESSVEILAAPAEGSGMYDNQNSLLNVEELIANNESDLPPLQEDAGAVAEIDMALAEQESPMMARNQSSLWVISGLIVLIFIAMGYYLLDQQKKTEVKVRSRSKSKKRPAVKKPVMATRPQMADPKMAMHKERLEQRRKMQAASSQIEQQQQIDALINDVLPLKEEELVISRTFHLPGIGQSFRIDPATTELKGPHFRQAAKVNKHSEEKMASGMRVDVPESGTQRPTKTKSSKVTGQTYHTIHKGSSKHFGSNK